MSKENRLVKRTKANQNFFEKIENNGGFVTVEDLSKITGLSVEDVEGLISTKQIVCFNKDGEIQIPSFQFYSGKPLPHLAEIIALLPEGLSPVAVCSFLLSEITLSGNNSKVRPIDIMKYGLRFNISEIKTQAALAYRHIAK